MSLPHLPGCSSPLNKIIVELDLYSSYISRHLANNASAFLSNC